MLGEIQQCSQSLPVHGLCFQIHHGNIIHLPTNKPWCSRCYSHHLLCNSLSKLFLQTLNSCWLPRPGFLAIITLYNLNTQIIFQTCWISNSKMTLQYFNCVINGFLFANDQHIINVDNDDTKILFHLLYTTCMDQLH